MAEVSFAVSTIGLVIPFVLTDPPISGFGAVPISNATLVTSCTWLNNRGQGRILTLSQAVSATFTYVVSGYDSRVAHVEEGYLEVKFGTNAFYTSSFLMTVFQHF